MTTNRRDFLRKGAATGGGLFFAGNLTGLFANAPATPRARRASVAWGR